MLNINLALNIAYFYARLHCPRCSAQLLTDLSNTHTRVEYAFLGCAHNSFYYMPAELSPAELVLRPFLFVCIGNNVTLHGVY